MEEAADGVMVKILCIAGIGAVGSSWIAYGAFKAGVINMRVFFACALSPIMRMNCVAAGFVRGQWMEESVGGDRCAKALEHTSDAPPAAG